MKETILPKLQLVGYFYMLAVISEGKFLFLKIYTDYRILLKCIVRK